MVRGREAGGWPEGPRDLWADALGVIFLLSLHEELDDPSFLSEAQWVAQEVDRVLGRRRGIRMGEGPDTEGQSFRSLAIWIFALHRLGQAIPRYKARALDLVREIHAPFVRPGAGIISRMNETLTLPYPGSDAGRLDVFLGLAVYRELDAQALRPEIEELEGMVQETYESLAPDNGADLGLLLWIAHLCPGQDLSLDLREKALEALDARWVDPPGYFRRGLSEPWNGPVRANRLAITNFSAAVGLKAQGLWAHRVDRLIQYFQEGYSWDTDGEDSLATVLNLVALYPGLLLNSHP
jgi:hypothetical protein